MIANGYVFPLQNEWTFSGVEPPPTVSWRYGWWLIFPGKFFLGPYFNKQRALEIEKFVGTEWEPKDASI